MPSITNFIFLEINEKEQTKTPFTILNPISIPGRASFVIEFSIILDENIDYTGYIEMFEPNGSTLIKTDSFSVEKEIFDDGDASKTDKEIEVLRGITLGINFEDVLFKVGGLYKVSLYLNDKVLGDFGITVAKEGKD